MSLQTIFTKRRKNKQKKNQINKIKVHLVYYSGRLFWHFVLGFMLLTDIDVVNTPWNLGSVQISYHILCPHPISLNYHFRTPSRIITLHHYCLIAFWHIFMHFVAFIVFFAHKNCILRVISLLILPPLPLKYHSQSQAPYQWVIWYLNAPSSYLILHTLML